MEGNAYRKEYTSRLNRVVDYINENLRGDLDLETLAKVANFSKFHFHRIFSSYVGEPLGSYIQRLRLEWAAGKLASDPELPVTEIAYECGYSAPAVFSRAFREWFGMSPSDWRGGGWRNHSKNRKVMSNRYQSLSNLRAASEVTFSYSSFRNQNWRIQMKETKELNYTVEVRDIKEMDVAYVRHTGPYAGDEELFGRLFGQLMRWAGPRNLLNFPDTEMLTIYHDSPEITEEDKLRISVCITVPPETKAEGDIGRMSIPGGRYAVGIFEIDVDQYGDAWNSLMGVWLPESGYQCADHGPCYEVGLNDPQEHPEGKHQIEIRVPVRPL